MFLVCRSALVVLVLGFVLDVQGAPCGAGEDGATAQVALSELSNLRVVNPFGNIRVNAVPVDSENFTISTTVYNGFSASLSVLAENETAGEYVVTVEGSLEGCQDTPTASSASWFYASPLLLPFSLIAAAVGIARGLLLPSAKTSSLVVLAVALYVACNQLPRTEAQLSCSCRNVDVQITVPVEAFILDRTYHVEDSALELSLSPQLHPEKTIVNGMSVNGITLTEGPTYDPRRDDFYFSEVDTGVVYRITNVSSMGEASLDIIIPDSNFANGLKYIDGFLYVCEFSRTNGSVVRYNLTGRDPIDRQVLAQFAPGGLNLGRPNDLTYDSMHRIYFTDRASSNPGYVTSGGVYRLDPPMTGVNSTDPWNITKILDDINVDPAFGADRSNGIVVSPDDSTLYVIETNSSVGGQRTVLAYDLDSEGNPSNKRVHYSFNPGRSGDGMAIDIEGNLHVNAGLNYPRNSVDTLDTRAGVHVISPEGELIEFIPLPVDLVTNVAFGGPDMRTVFANSGHKIFQWQSTVEGTMR